MSEFSDDGVSRNHFPPVSEKPVKQGTRVIKVESLDLIYEALKMVYLGYKPQDNEEAWERVNKALYEISKVRGW